MVSWDSAMEFCRRLSALPEKKRRDMFIGCRQRPNGNMHAGQAQPRPLVLDVSAGPQANCIGYGLCGRQKGGQTGAKTRPPLVHTHLTPLGLRYHGNVWQWCADWHHSEYAEAYPVDDLGWPRSGAVRACFGAARGTSCRTMPDLPAASGVRGAGGIC